MATFTKISQRENKHLVAVGRGDKFVPWCCFIQKVGNEEQIRFYGGLLSVGWVPGRHQTGEFPLAEALFSLLKSDETSLDFDCPDNAYDGEHVPSEPFFRSDWELWLLMNKKTGSGGEKTDTIPERHHSFL